MITQCCVIITLPISSKMLKIESYSSTISVREVWIVFCDFKVLTHWGRVTHICVSKVTIISSDNGLSPGRRQAIIWTNAGIWLIRPLETNLSEILIKIHIFSFTKIHLKMLSGKWQPSCLSLNELTLSVTGVLYSVSCCTSPCFNSTWVYIILLCIF